MKKPALLMLLLVAIGALGAAAFWFVNEQRLTAFAAEPFGSAEAKRVEIPPGTNPHGLANLLAEHEVVSSADRLYAWLRREKLGPKLKAGEYEFSGPLTPREVIEKIVSGQVKQYRFTVPEGLRVDEILPIVANSELKLSLDKLQKLAADPHF